MIWGDIPIFLETSTYINNRFDIVFLFFSWRARFGINHIDMVECHHSLLAGIEGRMPRKVCRVFWISKVPTQSGVMKGA